jgi:hypothetical protein
MPYTGRQGLDRQADGGYVYWCADLSPDLVPVEVQYHFPAVQALALATLDITRYKYKAVVEGRFKGMRSARPNQIYEFTDCRIVHAEPIVTPFGSFPTPPSMYPRPQP